MSIDWKLSVAKFSVFAKHYERMDLVGDKVLFLPALTLRVCDFRKYPRAMLSGD
jgi:hypothetical protein